MAIASMDSVQQEQRVSFVPVQESRIPAETPISSRPIEGATLAHTKLVSATASAPLMVALAAPKADRLLATNSVAAAKDLQSNQPNFGYHVQGLSGVNGPIDEVANWKIFEVPEPRTPPFPVGGTGICSCFRKCIV